MSVYNKDISQDQIWYALEKVLKGKITFDRVAEDTWRVSSGTQSGGYWKVTQSLPTLRVVTIDGDNNTMTVTEDGKLYCECPGRGFNGWCKHEILIGEAGLDAEIKSELRIGTSWLVYAPKSHRS